MAKCKECGKQDLFLKLNVRGLCAECAKKAKIAQKSSQIIISPTVNYEVMQNAKSIGHKDEEIACQFFISELTKQGKKNDLFRIEHRSSEYTTLVYGEFNDFIRIKITKKVCWISIALTDADQKENINNPLFERQKNKNQRHWKSYFDDSNKLEQYVGFAYNACQA